MSKVTAAKAPAQPAGAADTTASASGECKACEGSGYIETGIGEAPTTLCRKCDGTGRATLAPIASTSVSAPASQVAAQQVIGECAGYKDRSTLDDFIPGAFGGIPARYEPVYFAAQQGAAKAPEASDECAKCSEGHQFSNCGPNHERQCIYCCEPAAKAPAAQAVDAPILPPVVCVGRPFPTTDKATIFFERDVTDAELLAVNEALNSRLNRPAASPASTPEASQQIDESVMLHLSRELIAALKRLSFAAQTTGGTAGPDAELQAAIAQAEQALSLGAVARAMSASEASQQAAAVAAPPLWYNPAEVERARLTDYADQISIIGTSVKFGHNTTPLYAAPTAAAATTSEDARDAARLAEGYESGFFASSPQDGDGQFTLHYKTAAQAEAAYMLVTGIIDAAMRATQQEGGNA